jgi:hypothetical protein
MNVVYPSIVYIVMLNIASMASFEIIEPDLIINFLFRGGFTETDSVNTGWVQMENDSKVTISNLGSFFFILLANLAYIGFYYLLKPLECKCRCITTLREHMREAI